MNGPHHPSLLPLLAPHAQVPLRAIPVRCIALDAVIEAFLPLLPKAEEVAYRARQEEGKSAANKVNKMFWWLQPSAIPATAPAAAGSSSGGSSAHGSGSSGGGGMQAFGMQAPLAAAMAKAQQQQGYGAVMGAMQHGAFHHQSSSGAYGQGVAAATGPAGQLRRASQPGATQHHHHHNHHNNSHHHQQQHHNHQGGMSRGNARSSSFSAGGAPPPGHGMMHGGGMAGMQGAVGQQHQKHGGYGPSGSSDLDLELLTQQFAAAGMALPLMMQQQQNHHSQQFAGASQVQELAHMGSDHLGTSPTTTTQGSYDPAQLQQLLHGLYFA